MTLRRTVLPAATAVLWDILENEPLLKGFSLVGGTALALRIAHRQSEDLDFACVSEKLPSHRIDQLVHKIEEKGIHVELISDLAEEQNFLNDGLELRDYQRNYVADRVKLSLFSADPELRAVLSSQPVREEGPIVPALDRLFASKVLVCAHRSKTRDWLDIYMLCTKHGFRLNDMYRVFQQYDKYGWDSAIGRLTTMTIPSDDEGYRHMMSNPPSIEAMREFFVKERAALAAELARSTDRERTAARELAISSPKKPKKGKGRGGGIGDE